MLSWMLNTGFERMCYFTPICNIEIFFTIYQVFGKGARMVGNQFVVPEGISKRDKMGMQLSSYFRIYVG